MNRSQRAQLRAFQLIRQISIFIWTSTFLHGNLVHISNSATVWHQPKYVKNNQIKSLNVNESLSLLEINAPSNYLVWVFWRFVRCNCVEKLFDGQFNFCLVTRNSINNEFVRWLKKNFDRQTIFHVSLKRKTGSTSSFWWTK